MKVLVTMELTLYMAQPKGFVDKDRSNNAFKLKRDIYGLRAWYHKLRNFLIEYAFKNSISYASP